MIFLASAILERKCRDMWGDCDTVPGLAIYQLLRPENARFETVIRYIWNGREKAFSRAAAEIVTVFCPS